jgi:hypothetical protein
MKANDHIICDVDFIDLWINFKLIMESKNSKTFVTELELNIDKDMSGATFKKMSQKLTLQIWN